MTSIREGVEVILASGLGSVTVRDGLGAVRSYLDRIDAPVDLVGLDAVAAEMGRIIDVLEDVGERGDQAVLAVWREINQVVHSKWPAICEAIARCRKPKSRGRTKNSVRGSLRSNPLYGFLWNGIKDARFDAHYLQIKAALFRIWPLLRRRTSTDYLYQLGRCVRELGYTKFAPLMEQMPKDPLTVPDYLDVIERRLLADGERLPLVGQDHLAEICRAIRIGLGHASFSPRNHQGGVGGKGGGPMRSIPPSQRVLIYVGAVEDDTDPDYSGVRSYRLAHPDQAARWVGDIDITIDDYVEPSSLLELLPRADDYQDIDPVKEAIRMRGMFDAVAMRAQLLAMDWSSAGLLEIGRLFKAVAHHLDDLDGALLDGYLMLGCMLVLGMSPATLSTLRIFGSVPRALPTGSEVGYARKENVFVLRVTGPEYRARLDPHQKEEAIAVGEYAILGCPRIIQDVVERLHKNRDNGARSGYPAFPDKADTYERSVRKIIRSATDSALTDAAIRKRMFQEIYGQSRDLVEAIMLTGQSFGFVRTRLHYTTRPSRYLAWQHLRVHNTMVEKIAEEFGFGATFSGVWRIELPQVRHGEYVGARLTPRPQTVRKLVRGLRTELNRARSARNWTKLHNVYTAYVVSMLDFVTGSRSVARKYFFSTSLDEVCNVALLSDKDGGDFYNTRIGWLPPLVVEQLRAYMEHRQRVLEKMALHPGAAYGELSDPSAQQPSSWRAMELRRHVSDHYGLFFFLNDEFGVIPLRPKTLREQVSSHFHLPLNTNRHYLRFRLRNRGCDGEVIDAYLGHWQHGEAPGGRYSTLTVDEVMAAVRPRLECILGADRWRLEKGL